MIFRGLLAWLALSFCAAGAHAQDALQVVQDGRALATVYVSAAAGENEKAAAADLVKYVEMMSGARLPLMVVPEGALEPTGPPSAAASPRSSSPRTSPGR